MKKILFILFILFIPLVDAYPNIVIEEGVNKTTVYNLLNKTNKTMLDLVDIISFHDNRNIKYRGYARTLWDYDHNCFNSKIDIYDTNNIIDIDFLFYHELGHIYELCYLKKNITTERFANYFSYNRIIEIKQKGENMEIEKVEKLKNITDELELVQEEISRKKKEFENNNLHLFNERDELLKSISEIKKNISEDIKKEHNITGEKSYPGGIKVQIRKSLSYDKEAAIKWAESNMPVCIFKELNKKVFETFAKENDIECVTKNETPMVTFPKIISFPE